MLLSIVSPEYKGEKMVAELVRRIKDSVSPITEDYEIILVNDASPDNSWQEIKTQCQQDKRVKGLNLSRNFGQHYAITAGLRYAKGDWVVVMDCDLQDRPEEIPNLYNKAIEGWDSVLGRRVIRLDSGIKQLSSKWFYKVFSYLTDTKQDSSVANFGIYNRNVVDAILDMGDAMRYLPAQVQWVGFRIAYLPIEHSERAEGKSSYSFKRLFKLALDTIISFSDKPLKITVKSGFVITFLAFMAGLYSIVMWLLGKIEVMGYTSIVISIWFLSGVLISLFGLIGLYIGRMFETVKHRPLFIVAEKENID